MEKDRPGEEVQDATPPRRLAATEASAHGRRGGGGRPDPQWVRGRCPECGDDLVSNLYYIGGKGYLLVWQCWSSLGESPTCRYQKVL